jgi:hypothetical protein
MNAKELLRRRRQELEALSNEDLLGEDALEDLREAAIDRQVEQLEESLEGLPDDELIDQLEQIRQDAIDERCEELREALGDAADDELLGNALGDARECRIEALLDEYGETLNNRDEEE